eukprot:CAMPEP_0172519424 /NCGR_PEP_ID=MMETSP1066-20121228/291413_1 /TAXON_ID=671091 /ORGANISM="Coscinodiscus wailesii, Strain CCMP2513" /LENGTH=564 /DNA_ID=CAMNT_0013302013 /DNA_START=25 /DNA_END=1719 /DNA_ORIENTATION=+
MTRVPTLRLKIFLFQLLSLAWLCRSFNNPLGSTPWAMRNSVALSQFDVGGGPSNGDGLPINSDSTSINGDSVTSKDYYFSNGSQRRSEERGHYNEDVNGNYDYNNNGKHNRNAVQSIPASNSVFVGSKEAYRRVGSGVSTQDYSSSSRNYSSSNRNYGTDFGAYTPNQDSLSNGSSNRGYGSNYDSSSRGYDTNNGSSNRGYDTNIGSPIRGYDTNIGSPNSGYNTNSGSPNRGYSTNIGSPNTGYSTNSGSSNRGFSTNIGSPNSGYNTNSGSSNRGYSTNSVSPNNGYSTNSGSSNRGFSTNIGSPNSGYSTNSGSSNRGYETNSGSSIRDYRSDNGLNKDPSVRGYGSNYDSSNRGYDTNIGSPNRGYGANSGSSNRGFGTNYDSSNRAYGNSYESPNRAYSTNPSNSIVPHPTKRRSQNEWSSTLSRFDIERQLIGLTEILINSNLASDWNTYTSLCDPNLTCLEPEAMDQLVQGLQNHKRYFDLYRDERNRGRQTTMREPKVKLMGDRAAIVSYLRVSPGTDRNFRSAGSSTVGETRVWEVIDGRWLNVHFHRSVPAHR